jgi:hypothetical protein
MAETQTIFGQTTALARAVVAVLAAAQTAGAFAIDIAPYQRFARRVSLAQDGSAVLGMPLSTEAAIVDVFPGEEAEDRLTGGMTGVVRMTALYGIHILIQRRVDPADAETQMALLMQLRSQVVETVKPLSLKIDDAVKPYKTALVIALRSAPEGTYDLNWLEKYGCFYSDTIFTFKAPV